MEIFQVFVTMFQSRLLQICCMWERVYKFCPGSLNLQYQTFYNETSFVFNPVPLTTNLQQTTWVTFSEDIEINNWILLYRVEHIVANEGFAQYKDMYLCSLWAISPFTTIFSKVVYCSHQNAFASGKGETKNIIEASLVFEFHFLL